MNEIILLLLAVVGVFSIAGSYVLIALGKMVDEFPLEDETTRTRGITSPVESTKIAVVLFWGMFLPGAWAVLQEGIVTVIVGITLLFAICLFMLTALIFSFAVLSTMSRRKNENSDAVMGVSTPPPAASVSSSRAPGEPAVNITPRKNSLSNGIVHTLLKK
jgi:hypothetical protein